MVTSLEAKTAIRVWTVLTTANQTSVMYLFRILWGVDALVAFILLYFFFVGLGDNSVSSYNAGLWFLLLATMAGVLLGSLWLNAHQHRILANVLLSIIAIPGLLYSAFMLLLLLSNPRWN